MGHAHRTPHNIKRQHGSLAAQAPITPLRRPYAWTGHYHYERPMAVSPMVIYLPRRTPETPLTGE